ncbi:MAG: PD40 domain-containing protein [Fimbriimonas ginsengisoli]|uniref:Tricorn protease homolog n=1 Tax=Fimbriimonas ginsengisoli TaxID=1005039 RepID=A0A931PTU4_FIMGI|nr:PD40 domain-containing protein [Fimbriimonas ginsengisoli]
MSSLRPMLVATALALVAAAHADPIRRASTPAISPDGGRIAFSWQGDIWVVPRSGGRAERLTVHPATDTAPRWTPDGKRVVFASNRHGHYDVYSMQATGGDVQRLTSDSGNSVPDCVSADGRTIYGHSSAFTGGRFNLFKVPITGGELVRLTDHTYEGAYFAATLPGGKRLVYNRGSYGTGGWLKPTTKSAAMPNLWVADVGVPLTNQHPIAKSESTQMFPAASSAGSIFYVSNASGWPNLWRINADGSGAKRLTDHRDGTMRYPSVSLDGRWVAYDFESELYVYDAVAAKPTKIEVDVPIDQRSNPVSDLELTSGVQDFAVAPDGKRLALAVRGDLYVIPEKGGFTRRLTTNAGFDGQPVLLDPKKILYVAGDAGHRELMTVTIDGKRESFLKDPKDLTHPSLSPDGKTVAFLRGTDEIAVIPVAGGTPKVVIEGSFNESLLGDTPFSWSPDGKWLVVDVQTPLASSEVTLVEVGGERRVVVARTARGAGVPQFLPNGKGVFFLANEYGSQVDLFVVDLTPQELVFTEDELDKPVDKPEAKKPEPPVVEVDPVGIERRLRRLTTGLGIADDDQPIPIASADSKSIYARVGGQLVAVPVAGGAAKPAEGAPTGISSIKLSGKKLIVLAGGKLSGIDLDPAGAFAKPGSIPIPFAASASIDVRQEEQALFDEIWWAMDRLYYDSKLNGKDWPAIKDKFQQVLPFTADRGDFYDLMEEMMEELDSSHLGSSAPSVETPGADAPGYIGVEFDPVALDARSVYIVKRIVPGSPAAHPQSRLTVGDRVVAVDAVEPSSTKTVASLLNHKVAKKVVLTVERGDKKLDIALKPVGPAMQRQLEYDAWVEWQRKETDRLSGGKLAYLHVRAMDEASYELFLRQIRTLTVGKKGAIVDVRYNGGGSTSHRLLSVLIKTPWLIRTTRGAHGLRLSENIYRGDSLELPTALLANSSSFSNAEVMAEGFRRLGRGPIIGERTPGYVIGTGAMALWDGGRIRTPVIGAYAVGGENLEANGRRPDFAVPFDPDAWTQGRDTQLEKAVEELLKQVK